MTNEGLVSEMQKAYGELNTAQDELKDVNANLEAKIRVRTLDLQQEVTPRRATPRS